MFQVPFMTMRFDCSIYISGRTPILPTASSDKIGRRRGSRRKGTRAATAAGIGGGRRRLPIVVYPFYTPNPRINIKKNTNISFHYYIEKI